MNKNIWYIILFLLMMIWGLNIVGIKYLVEYLPPVTMQALRVFIAGMVLVVVVFFTRNLRKLTKKELYYTSLAGIFGVLGHHFFISLGLARTTATNGALILALVPLVTSLLAVIFLGDRLTFIRLTGIILGLFGVTFIVVKGNANIGRISLGDILMLGAVLTQAIGFVFIKKGTKTIDSKLMTSLMMIIGSFSLFIVSQFLEPGGVKEVRSDNPFVWIIFLASAIIATGLGHLIYNTAMHHLGAGQTSIFINIAPFFSLVGSALFLDETIHPEQILGFILIIGGVLLGTGTVENYFKLKRDRRLAMRSGL